jgi:hypothetical protein
MASQLRPLVQGLGLDNPPHMYLAPEKLHFKNLNTTNRRPVDVKWRFLEFSCLLSSALKLSSKCQRPHGHFRLVTFRSQTYCGMQTTTLQWTVEGQLHSQICPRIATDRAAPLLKCRRNATNRGTILDLWHSADDAMYIFEYGMWHYSEIQPLPFYIESLPVWSVISYWLPTSIV